MVTTISQNQCFGGVQGVYSHASAPTGCTMRFGVFLPPQAADAAVRVPVLYWLSGLTCTEENFIIKAGAQRVAAELGLAIVVPDTSPRGPGVPGEADSYDFGVGAGFYVDADPGALVAAFPHGFLRHQGIAGRGGRGFPGGWVAGRHLRPFHGRPRRPRSGACAIRTPTGRSRPSRRSARRCAALGAKTR